jgi:hypothetical protein
LLLCDITKDNNVSKSAIVATEEGKNWGVSFEIIK